MSITFDILALYEIIWTYLSKNAKQLFQMSKQFKMKVYKFSNSTIFDNQEAVSEYNSKLISNLRKLHENTQDSHPEVCSKSFKTKNQVTIYCQHTYYEPTFDHSSLLLHW